MQGRTAGWAERHGRPLPTARCGPVLLPAGRPPSATSYRVAQQHPGRPVQAPARVARAVEVGRQRQLAKGTNAAAGRRAAAQAARMRGRSHQAARPASARWGERPSTSQRESAQAAAIGSASRRSEGGSAPTPRPISGRRPASDQRQAGQPVADAAQLQAAGQRDAASSGSGRCASGGGRRPGRSAPPCAMAARTSRPQRTVLAICLASDSIEVGASKKISPSRVIRMMPTLAPMLREAAPRSKGSRRARSGPAPPSPSAGC